MNNIIKLVKVTNASADEKIFDNSFSDIDINVLKIFSSDSKKEKVLCIGEVQSGKTRNIIGAIKHSMLTGYKAAIFLGGTNNILTSQSEERVIREFSQETEKNYVRIINKKNIEWFSNNFNVLMNENIFYIFVIPKLVKCLKKIIKDFFKIINHNENKILLIDDECDFASNNIGENGRESAIFSAINTMYQSMLCGKMLSVTATPFSNIREQIKNGSEKYDRAILFKHSDEYTGSEYFFAKSDKYYVYVDSSKGDISTWESAIDDSLHIWLFSTAIALINECPTFKSELLINIDVKTLSQQEISMILKKNMKKIKEYISLYSNSENILLKKIMKRFSFPESERKVLIEKVKFIIDYFTKQNQKNIILLNCESDDNFITGSEQFSIIIGGNLISRGFTFDNLTTELIINSPVSQDSLDTLLQRARWFGYRKINNRDKYMTIIMNKKLLESYKEANDVIKSINSCGDDIDKLKNLVLEGGKNLKNVRFTGKK